jgi:L-methionine (R)-S-oxide reductase
MAEDLILTAGLDKGRRYDELVPQIEALMAGEQDLVANMANMAAALRQGMGFFWVGFYLVNDGQLVLGPFQGPVACTRIAFGRGVCGTAWKEKRTLLVPDVEEFPGHIACSSVSKSEIVVPGFRHDGEVAWVLDVDSDRLDDFDPVDQHYLERCMRLLEQTLI